MKTRTVEFSIKKEDGVWFRKKVVAKEIGENNPL